MFNIDFNKIPNTDGNFLVFAGVLLAGFVGCEAVSHGYSLTGGNGKLTPGDQHKTLTGDDEDKAASGDDPDAVDV